MSCLSGYHVWDTKGTTLVLSRNTENVFVGWNGPFMEALGPSIQRNCVEFRPACNGTSPRHQKQYVQYVCFFHERIFVSISRENHYKLSGKEKRSDLHISVAASCIELAFTGCPSWPVHRGSFFNEWYSEWVNARSLSFCMLGSTRHSREPMKMESSWIFRASLAKYHKMGHLK